MKDLYEFRTEEKDGFKTSKVERWSGEIWCVISPNEGLFDDVEFFDSRPQSPGIDPDPRCEANWPDIYEIRVGYVNGGDSAVIERKNSYGEIFVYEAGEKVWEK